MRVQLVLSMGLEAAANSCSEWKPVLDPSVLLWKVSASRNAVDRVEVTCEDTEIISPQTPTYLDLVAFTALQFSSLSPEAGVLTWQ